MDSETAQIIAGIMISAAYVPQILKMKQNDSSEDVSMSFLLMIFVSLIMMGWYSFDMYWQTEGHLMENKFFPLVITNVVNFVMVVLTIWYAFKLRR
jgi:uncharacterized protein with PQ loop repeat